MSSSRISYFRYVGRDRENEFVQRGFKKRYFFPHRTYYLPKCGPDGFKIARRMYGHCDLDQLWEVVLYADESVIAEFPSYLFYDSDIVWHQQHFGKPGHIATANLIIAGNTLYSMVHVSDVVQRISRRRNHKTRIENKFKGWTHMLLNSILNFAVERNLSSLFLPTAELARLHTDRRRNVGHEMFDRIYNRTVERLYACRQNSGWWAIDVRENRDRLVRPERRSESIPEEKAICICHDIERGLGHRKEEPSFARWADEISPAHLTRMLSVERNLAVKATYNVLGSILPEVRAGIEESGHCLGFHSFDHDIGRRDQLPRCRNIDYRIKGYRPPQSKLTPELSAEHLCFHNFEWLASSEFSLQINTPELQNRLVKIPILMDDFDLHRNPEKMEIFGEDSAYERWEKRVLTQAEQRRFVAISLHDCYADLWLPRYESLLEKIGRLGTFKTLDEVAASLILTNSH